MCISRAHVRAQSLLASLCVLALWLYARVQPRAVPMAKRGKCEKPSGSQTGASRKRARHHLTTLARTSHVSQSGLAKLAESFAKDGVPEHAGRFVQYKARKERGATMTPYGPLVDTMDLPCEKKGKQRVGIQNPLAMFFQCCLVSVALSGLVMAKLEDHPLPWNVIFYVDGISPSDTMTMHDRRSLQAMYWTFEELGQENLGREELWIEVASLRDSLVKDVDGGLSHVVKLVMNQFLFGPETSFAKGMHLQFHGQEAPTTFLAARLGCILSDELALAEMLLCKGHGGYKPCLLCSNVILKMYYYLFAGSDWPVPSTTTDMSKIKLHTSASARETLDRLAALKDELPKGQFEEREKIFGFTYNKHGLLWDPWLAVDIASTVMFDWMHIYLVGGLCHVSSSVTCVSFGVW